MKKILITGINSYVGNSLAEWLEKDPDSYEINRISLRDGFWKELDFSFYDVVVHVAGIAHQKETKENEHLYYEINRDLAVEVAEKAKSKGVKQFIFLSSMSVYGLDQGVIDENTPLEPKSHYGKSKLQAEEQINKLIDSKFKVAIIRPPMIYGKECPGNYQRLRKLTLKTPIFPNIDNKRSMIYVDNLSEFMRYLIDNVDKGLYFPQNLEYVNTSEMVQMIAKQHGKKIKLTKAFNLLLTLMNIGIIKKIFGSLMYKKDNQMYYSSFIDNSKSIELTEE